jgi:AraC family transcriptional regulator
MRELGIRMARPPAVARLNWTDAKIVHCLIGSASEPSRKSAYDLSLTDPSSISLAFHGSTEAVLDKSGATITRRIAGGDITLCGPEPTRWLDTSGPGVGDFIEITATAGFRRELAEEMGVPGHFDLDDVHGWNDRTLWAIAARFRSAARKTLPLSDLERDLLLRRLYARAFEMRFGGREPGRGQGGLDTIRLNRVYEFIEAELENQLTIAMLADIAALSPFHFVRAFRQSTGFTPHRYVRARRLERARNLLAAGLNARSVAQRIGYEGFSHFRAAYRTHFGFSYESDRRRRELS